MNQKRVQEIQNIVDEAMKMSEGFWDIHEYEAQHHEGVWSPKTLEENGYACIDSPVPVAHGVNPNWIEYMEAVRPNNVRALFNEIERLQKENLLLRAEQGLQMDVTGRLKMVCPKCEEEHYSV